MRNRLFGTFLRNISNRRKFKRIHCYLLAFVIIFYVFTTILVNMRTIIFTSPPSKLHRSNEDAIDHPVVVWWSKNFVLYEQKIAKCDLGDCKFIVSKVPEVVRNAKGFLFYGTSFDIYDLPLPRKPDTVLWGLVHEESPRNKMILCHEPALRLFNYSATFSRHSDVPLTLQYLKGIEEITTTDYFLHTKGKNVLMNKLAPVLYIQSDCDTSSYRDAYVKELMKHVRVDSYGKCLNNKRLPDELKDDYLNKLDSEEFLKFVGRYKFTIAFENGICEDYITEKLWRPLKVGSIPVYLGSPSVKDWLPYDRIAIDVREFQSPEDLAEYITYLNDHNQRYDEYMQHKLNKKITNRRLIEMLKSNNSHSFARNSNTQDIVDTFECFFCNKIHQNVQNVKTEMAILNQNHYHCLKPLPPYIRLDTSWWLDLWRTTQHEAELLNKLVLHEKSRKIVKEEFETLLNLNYDLEAEEPEE